MKFTAGMWMMQEGIEPNWAGNVYKKTITEDSVRLLLSKTLRGRGDTLNDGTITTVLTSPAEDVISVKSTHWIGGVKAGPQFELSSQDKKADVRLEGDHVVLKTGNLSAVVNAAENSFAVDFLGADGERLTGHSFRSLGYMKDMKSNHYSEGLFRGHVGYMTANLDIGVGETVYGLGERFGSFIKNGQVVDVWNEDGGTSSELTYKNIPFYLTNRGYGVLVRHTGKISFEVQSERTTRCNISVQDEQLEYLIIYGPSPKEILNKYTTLTGKPPILPAWSYGLWLTTSFTTDYDEKTVTGFLDGFSDRDIPLRVFHFDAFWMRGFEWCNFEFDPDMFPDPSGYLQRLQKDKCLRICVWINSYIAQESALFAQGMDAGYLIKRTDGTVFQWDQWQAGMGVVDFTNPEACTWYQSHLERLIDKGVTAFKTDFGERIPFQNVKFHDGSDPELMHNYYPQLYNRCVQSLLDRKLGPGKGCLFARSATVGGQTMPVHWGGDCESTFEAMAETLRGGLSLGLCGFGYWAHDIGGFEGLPSPMIYKRWVQFGLLSSHSRLHGSSSYRVPWLYDDEACDVLRQFTKLKISLSPYLFRCGVEAAELGTPVLRAMLVEFPEDRNVWGLDRQYMFGPSLLVAPIFNAKGKVSFYVPEEEGKWVGFLNGKEYIGGKWYDEVHAFDSLPILVRPNALVVLNTKIRQPDNDIEDGLQLVVGDLGKGKATVALYNGEGKGFGSFSAESHEGKIAVQAEGVKKDWTIRKAGGKPVDVSGSRIEF